MRGEGLEEVKGCDGRKEERGRTQIFTWIDTTDTDLVYYRP